MLRDPDFDQAFFSLNSASWPLPVGEVEETVFSQVPLGTRVQALPW
jgi:hypothetical protein